MLSECQVEESCQNHRDPGRQTIHDLRLQGRNQETPGSAEWTQPRFHRTQYKYLGSAIIDLVYERTQFRSGNDCVFNLVLGIPTRSGFPLPR